MREKIMVYARKTYGNEIPKKVLERLNYEFKVIEDCNLSNDLISLAEIINIWREKQYFIIGDGYLKESLIAYLLGIIYVDPMRLNKLFDLDFGTRTFKIIIPKDIENAFDDNLKEKVQNIQIEYSNCFEVELLSELEYVCETLIKDKSFDEEEVLKKFVKKATLGRALTIEDGLDLKYGMKTSFGYDDEKLKIFYDYINYDKDHNDEYSTSLVNYYYITYFRVHFEEKFYQIYIDFLMEALAKDTHFEEEHKMQYLKRQIVEVYNNGYKLQCL